MLRLFATTEVYSVWSSGNHAIWIEWLNCHILHYESIWYDNIYTATRLWGLESAICLMFLQCGARLRQQHHFELFSILSTINHTPFAQRVLFRSFAKKDLRSMFSLINLPDWSSIDLHKVPRNSQCYSARWIESTYEDIFSSRTGNLTSVYLITYFGDIFPS